MVINDNIIINIKVLFDIVKTRSQTKSHDWYSLLEPNLVFKANKVMKTVNWHVALITYFTTRAMHIKIAGDLSIGKFMLVLKAIFCWLR